MNIITIIQTALDALNSDAELFLLQKARAENMELENTKDTIVVYPDDTANNDFTQSLEINTNAVYNIDFKTPDEWDNSDGNLPTAYESETSADRIDNMEILADSVFYYITANNNLFPEIREKLKWTAPRPILRANNGTMSGVNIQLTVVYSGDRECDYTPIVVDNFIFEDANNFIFEDVDNFIFE